MSAHAPSVLVAKFVSALFGVGAFVDHASRVVDEGVDGRAGGDVVGAEGANSSLVGDVEDAQAEGVAVAFARGADLVAELGEGSFAARGVAAHHVDGRSLEGESPGRLEAYALIRARDDEHSAAKVALEARVVEGLGGGVVAGLEEVACPLEGPNGANARRVTSRRRREEEWRGCARRARSRNYDTSSAPHATSRRGTTDIVSEEKS